MNLLRNISKINIKFNNLREKFTLRNLFITLVSLVFAYLLKLSINYLFTLDMDTWQDYLLLGFIFENVFTVLHCMDGGGSGSASGSRPNSPTPSLAHLSPAASPAASETLAEPQSRMLLQYGAEPFPATDYEIRSNRTNLNSNPFPVRDCEGKLVKAWIPDRELNITEELTSKEARIEATNSKHDLTKAYNSLSKRLYDYATDWSRYETARQYYEYKLGNRADVTNNATMCKDLVEENYTSGNSNTSDLSDYNKMIEHINNNVADRESVFKTFRHLQSKTRSRLDNLGASYSPAPNTQETESQMSDILESVTRRQ